jgi:hypothetical protein
MVSKKALKMDEKDNVATLTSDADAGDFVEAISRTGNVEIHVKATDQIPFGHKISLTNIEKNGKIIKYGKIIGVSSKSIKKGEHVHVHNVKSLKVR